jgi:hypothetical protein
VLSVLARRGRSLALEVRDLARHSVVEGGISVPGYLKQRLKLNPEALLFLARHHASRFYEDDGAVDTYKGYLLLAVDGSTANLPTTPETIEAYCDASSHGRPQAMCGLSAMFDVLNRQMVDLIITSGNFDERGKVPLHVASANEVLGNRPYVLIGDRGYPSLTLFSKLMDAGVPFVIRSTSAFLAAEFRAMQSDDEDVTVELTPARCAWQRGRDPEAYRRLRDRGCMDLRLVRVPLGNGGEEWVITTLDRREFPAEDIAEIYRLRWGVETVFSVMKDKLQMENFSGTNPVLIEQDIYATAYLINVMYDLAQDAERRMHEGKSLRPVPHKHDMAINKTFAIGLVKDEMIRFVLAAADQREAIMAGILDELSRHIVPVRRGRAYERRLTPRHNRYSNTHKRAF